MLWLGRYVTVVGPGGTLVDVVAGDAVARIASVAGAGEGSIGVGALGVVGLHTSGTTGAAVGKCSSRLQNLSTTPWSTERRLLASPYKIFALLDALPPLRLALQGQNSSPGSFLGRLFSRFPGLYWLVLKAEAGTDTKFGHHPYGRQ